MSVLFWESCQDKNKIFITYFLPRGGCWDTGVTGVHWYWVTPQDVLSSTNMERCAQMVLLMFTKRYTSMRSFDQRILIS